MANADITLTPPIDDLFNVCALLTAGRAMCDQGSDEPGKVDSTDTGRLFSMAADQLVEIAERLSNIQTALIKEGVNV